MKCTKGTWQVKHVHGVKCVSGKHVHCTKGSGYSGRYHAAC